jgi:peptidyl-prolyl cis-trans isomerase SurA
MMKSTLSLLAFGLVLSLFSPAKAEIVERIVAIVNDEIITQTDLSKYIDRLKSGGLTDDLLIPDDATKQEMIKDRSKLLQKMIDEKIIDSEVKRQNLSIPIERVEQEIRTIAKRNNVGREELKAALAERGIAFSAYQDFIKTGLERQSLIEKAITSRIKISEDDVLAAFATNRKGEGDQAYEFTLAQVYFSNEKPGGAPAAKARAEKSLKRLRAGDSFDRVAAEDTEDTGFEPGGALGVFRTGELQKDLERTVQKLAANEFTDVMPTAGGYHIVKVNKKRLIADPRTEKEREKIRAELYEKAYKRQFSSWLEQLRSEAFIRINK